MSDPISLYGVSVPIFRQFLDSLSGLLHKASAHAEANGIDPSALLTMRPEPADRAGHHLRDLLETPVAPRRR